MLRLVEESEFVFEPEELAKVGERFDDCWERVLQSGVRFASERELQAARETLAKGFIDSARRGRRDPGGYVRTQVLGA